MSRRWNRFKSGVYTRLAWVPELYGRVKGVRPAGSALPPLARPRVPLFRARVALLTSAGVHLTEQPPFDMNNPHGDASFRVIPGSVDLGALTITHDYYDHRAADRDLNCVFPLERLRELVDAGEVGEVAPRHVGFMGHLLHGQWLRLQRETAPRIAALLREDRVDAVIASPG
jgi:D-proline reductase (dithiol) PrdB